MKKIYILTAVLALLTLSLNAQMLPYKTIGKKDVYLDKGKPASTAGLFRAPAKINTADGEFLVGPYTTDDFSTTGKGLYSTTGEGRVEVSTVIPRADIEQYIGQEIVGYRFATVGGTVSCYSFLVESEGPNYYIDDLYYWNIQSDGSYYDLSGNQWHEYYLDEPVVFQVPDTTQAIWIGYKYWQESSNNGSYTMTPIAVNPNVTSYDCYAYSYNQNNQGFYDVTSTLGGAVAAQLIFKAPSTDPKITEKPTITYTTDGETVTITATANEPDANAEVTLTVGNGEPVTATGSVSVTVPCGVQSSSVTATATAQVNGKAQSETETAQITIPAGESWKEMTETYNNPNDLLSFKVKVGNDTTDIMLIDQFLQSTVLNNHPGSYTYILKETKVINGVDSTMTSNPAVIPVYKTNSTMRGLYTEAQVLADDYADEANRLTANAVNGEMDYNVVPDNNVLYYSLYRGGIQEETPVVDVDHRISQLQKFEDKVGDNVTYYFTENHPTGILPRYDHEDNIGSQTVERLDVDYVTGETGDQMSYVPVIWTFGLYTARGDGKNNSYGSDIKYNELGGVDVSSDIIVNWSDNNKMKVNGVDYYVVSPVITLDAVAPELGASNDGETYKYVPYMYRVWCTYTDAHNFGHLLNPDGINYSLVETGLIPAPFLIGEVKADTISDDPTHIVIGRDLGHVSPQTQWSFAVTKEAVTNGDIKFVVRYYYKKVVTEPASPDQPAGMRGNRDGGADYAIYEKSTSSSNIVTGVNELWSGYGKVVISQTYVNAQGMQSDKPFDGLNIVVTRFSDGTTTTTKVVR